MKVFKMKPVLQEEKPTELVECLSHNGLGVSSNPLCWGRYRGATINLLMTNYKGSETDLIEIMLNPNTGLPNEYWLGRWNNGCSPSHSDITAVFSEVTKKPKLKPIEFIKEVHVSSSGSVLYIVENTDSLIRSIESVALVMTKFRDGLDLILTNAHTKHPLMFLGRWNDGYVR